MKGRTQTSLYTDSNGMEKFYQYIYAEEINVIDYKDADNVKYEELPEQTMELEEIDDEDLPF